MATARPNLAGDHARGLISSFDISAWGSWKCRLTLSCSVLRVFKSVAVRCSRCACSARPSSTSKMKIEALLDEYIGGGGVTNAKEDNLNHQGVSSFLASPYHQSPARSHPLTSTSSTCHNCHPPTTHISSTLNTLHESVESFHASLLVVPVVSTLRADAINQMDSARQLGRSRSHMSRVDLKQSKVSVMAMKQRRKYLQFSR